VVTTVAARRADGTQPSELDALIHRDWYLQEYLAAPGLIRKGERISRREVLKHMANEMGGVHLGESESSIKDLLENADDKLFLESTSGSIRTFYIEVLAIGQAVGRSDDFMRLAARIRGG
jgi:hypothetical protein